MEQLNAKREFNANIIFAGHFDDLGELDRFLSCVLEIFNREYLKS